MDSADGGWGIERGGRRRDRKPAKGPGRRRSRPAIAEAAAHDALAGIVAILDHVREHGATTRPELVRATRLSPYRVAQRVSELVDFGLLAEGSLAASTGGRQPRLLRFRADAGHLLVADVAIGRLEVAVADLGGTVVAQTGEPLESTAPEEALERVSDHYQRFRRELPLAGALWGIGLGVPGRVDPAGARAGGAPILPGWDERVLNQRLAGYDAPVWVESTVNVAALGELRAGAARGHQDVLFVAVGEEIDAALITRGRLHRGASGYAGEIGHLKVVDDSDAICVCGNTGCLAAALAERGVRAADDVTLAAAQGDTESVAQISRLGRLVGAAVAEVVTLLNPSLVVVGGPAAGAGDGFLAAMRQSVYQRSHPGASRDVGLERSALGSIAGVTGAAAMVSDELFAPGRVAELLRAGARVA